MIVFSARGRDGVHQLQFLPDGELAARTGTGLCVWGNCRKVIYQHAGVVSEIPDPVRTRDW